MDALTAGTILTPNYLRTPKISVSPFCDCSSSGNNKDECDKFTEFFAENTCLRESPPHPLTPLLLLLILTLSSSPSRISPNVPPHSLLFCHLFIPSHLSSSSSSSSSSLSHISPPHLPPPSLLF
jgi:hypothetical protein